MVHCIALHMIVKPAKSFSTLEKLGLAQTMFWRAPKFLGEVHWKTDGFK